MIMVMATQDDDDVLYKVMKRCLHVCVCTCLGCVFRCCNAEKLRSVFFRHPLLL